MIVFGLASSIFDFITFFVLFQIFHASAAQFQTGWFIESLATQTLIILIIRTKLIPFVQSRPAKSLLLSTILAVILGWSLTYLSLGNWFGFVALPWNLLGILAGIVIAYLITVEVIKHWFYKKFSY
jgi:Mg2+-importing ATPase